MPRDTRIPAALARRGLRVEVVPGWETRGSASFNPKAAVCHWTAGQLGGDRPSLQVCVTGRPDLPGPLCNVFLSRNGTAIVVAAGRANHAGRGGWNGLVGNSAAYGTEAEYHPDLGTWTDAQRRAYPLVNAAYVDLGVPVENICGHNEWAYPQGRKLDIRDWPMPVMRAQVLALTRQGADDLQPDERDWLYQIRYMLAEALEKNHGLPWQQIHLGQPVLQTNHLAGLILAELGALRGETSAVRAAVEAQADPLHAIDVLKQLIEKVQTDLDGIEVIAGQRASKEDIRNLLHELTAPPT